MISKNQIQYVRSLRQKKYRAQHRRFVVEGRKMLQELLRSDFVTGQIFAVREWEIPSDFTQKAAGSVQRISPGDLGRISSLTTPDQVLAVVEFPDWEMSSADQLNGLTLLLDGINDPGNLGTIIRIADWYGINTIICSPDTVEVFNPKVVQASMGSLFRMKVIYHDLQEILNDPSRSVKAFGACMDGENIYSMDLPEEAFIIIGSESHGISNGLQLLLDKKINIPSADGGAESLNAAVAAGIICSEFRRNNLKNP